MATPIVSGAIADLLTKKPWASNDAVKALLCGSCDDLGMSNNQQGNGMLNVKKLLES